MEAVETKTPVWESRKAAADGRKRTHARRRTDGSEWARRKCAGSETACAGCKRPGSGSKSARRPGSKSTRGCGKASAGGTMES
jgi:hypothetical protein